MTLPAPTNPVNPPEASDYSGLDNFGGGKYQLPIATETELGTVMAKTKVAESVPIAVDTNGRLYAPVATSLYHGCVRAKVKTTESVQVAIDSAGRLFVPASGSGETGGGGDPGISATSGIVIIDKVEFDAMDEAQTATALFAKIQALVDQIDGTNGEVILHAGELEGLDQSGVDELTEITAVINSLPTIVTEIDAINGAKI